MKKSTLPYPLLLSLCFLSGVSALIYEVVWIRIFSLTFGATIIAVAVVVSVFMAGLGLGSIYFGEKADKTANPVKLFGVLELGIGVYSLFLVFLFQTLPVLYKTIHAVFKSGFLSFPTMTLLAAMTIFIPTMFMGGTIPVLSKIYIRKYKDIGKGIGMLYGFNTLGSIIGVALTGFFLIRYFGQNITLFTAVALNLIIGAAALFFAKNSAQPSTATKKEKKPLTTPPYPSSILILSLIIAGITGFCSLAYEILWTRSLHIFLSNSTYSFTSVLVIFLAGITSGSFLFRRFLSEKKEMVMILIICQAGIAIYAIITGFFLNRIPGLLFLFRGILEIPLLRIIIPGLFLSFVIMFLPTLLMGISFPLICRIYTRNVQQLAKSIGWVYFMNTAGAILGSLGAAFVIIPCFGVIRGIILIAGLNLLTAVLLIIATAKKEKKTKYWLVPSSVLVIVTLIFFIGFSNQMVLPPSLFRSRMRSDKILYYKETRDGTVVVTEDEFTGIRACYVNNNAVCGTTYDALKVVKMLGHLPFIINPSARNVLIVGFGIGITASTVATHTPECLDCVEICPGVKEAAAFFTQFNHGIMHNPKINFIPADGRNFILLTDRKYDIISCDPTHPILGCNSLYTKEYFDLCKKHLSRDGVICQYLPLHKLSPEEFKILIKTFSSVFPHTTIWLAHSHAILVAADEEIIIDFSLLKERLKELNDPFLDDPYLLAVSIMLDEEAVQKYTKGAKINTDDRPYLEFFSGKTLKRENWHKNLLSLMRYRIDPKDVIKGIKDEVKIEHYLAGQYYFLNGLVYKNKGDLRKVIENFKTAILRNPENREIKLFLENELRALSHKNFY
ncbi:MAG TPA: hypothetical protein ENI34_04245 [candidate division WOR-3 bacterium]|uniref:PABS domain-containing protein n=1 Tax=candidate division WOR-3 bacterium TaxID=2052148 RepID=A0A9C9ELH1_UNCW3|nr:hypothetical protein [candidate division WOR-3 bacterium]